MSVPTTATAPKWVVEDLLENFFGKVRAPLIICQRTNRHNISFQVVNSSESSLVGKVVNDLDGLIRKYGDTDRAIVYSPTIARVAEGQSGLPGRPARPDI